MIICTDVIQAIKGGEEGMRRAMEMIYLDPDFQKIARYRYGQCFCPKRKGEASLPAKQAQDVFTWEDFFMESIEVFIATVLEGRDIRNCYAYFRMFTGLDTCKKLCRGLQEGEVSAADDDAPVEAVLPYFNKLGRQCQLIMIWYCFCRGKRGNSESLKLLHDILRLNGYSVDGNSLPALITNCKRQLRDLIDDDFWDKLA